MTNIPRYLVIIAATAIALFLVWYFSSIVAYILISAVLAIIGHPLVSKLESLRLKGRNMPRWMAAAVTLVTIWVVGVLFFYLFLPLVYGKLNELSAFDMEHVADMIREPLNELQARLEKAFSIRNSDFSIADELSKQAPIINMDGVNRALQSFISFIGGALVALFSITFITFFFLKEDQLFVNMIAAVLPTKYEENVRRAMDSVTKLLIRYFTGILTESTLIMFAIAITLMLFGFSAQTAFFMGLVMGILNVIPYIGPIIGATLCLLIGLFTPTIAASPVNIFLIIGGTILVVKGLDDFILQPWLYSNRVKAHPLEIFLVILIAGNVAGILGMWLAIPAYTVLRVFAKEFFNNFRLVQKLTEKI